MNYQEIKKLVKLVESSGIGRIEIEEPDFRVEIEKQPQLAQVSPMNLQPMMQAAPAPEAPPAGEVAPTVDANQHVLTSPMVGTFYAAPSPDDPAFASEGDEVHPGQILCIIEAMKVMNEIESDVRGTVRRVMVDDGQPVQYEDPLFIIEPL